MIAFFANIKVECIAMLKTQTVWRIAEGAGATIPSNTVVADDSREEQQHSENTAHNFERL
jgi:hypothetical protein